METTRVYQTLHKFEKTQTETYEMIKTAGL
jgi:hypothetical protein